MTTLPLRPLSYDRFANDEHSSSSSSSAPSSSQSDALVHTIHSLIIQKAQSLSVDELLALDTRLQDREMQYAEQRAQLTRRTLDAEKAWWERRREIERDIALMHDKTLQKELQVIRERQAAVQAEERVLGFSPSSGRFRSITDALKKSATTNSNHYANGSGCKSSGDKSDGASASSRDSVKKRKVEAENGDSCPRYSEQFLASSNYLSRTEILKRLFLNPEALNPGHKMYHHLLLEADAHRPESKVLNLRWNSSPYWPLTHALEFVDSLLCKYKDGDEMHGVIVRLNHEFLTAWREKRLTSRDAVLNVTRVTNYTRPGAKKSGSQDESNSAATASDKSSQLSPAAAGESANQSPDDTQPDRPASSSTADKAALSRTDDGARHMPSVGAMHAQQSVSLQQYADLAAQANTAATALASLQRHDSESVLNQLLTHSQTQPQARQLPDQPSQPQGQQPQQSQQPQQDQQQAPGSCHASAPPTSNDLNAFMQQALASSSSGAQTQAAAEGALSKFSSPWLFSEPPALSSSSLTAALSLAVAEPFNFGSPANAQNRHRAGRHVRSRSLSIPLPITDPALYASPPSPLGLPSNPPNLLRDVGTLDLSQPAQFPEFMDLAMLSAANHHTARLLAGDIDLSTPALSYSLEGLALQMPMLDSVRTSTPAAANPSLLSLASAASAAASSKLSAGTQHLQQQFQLSNLAGLACPPAASADDLMRAILLSPVGTNNQQ
ncbi:hypothetical protein RI367_001676 [Sorochytrium milnesiophthora]